MASIGCWDALKKEGRRCQQTTATRLLSMMCPHHSTDVSNPAKAGNLKRARCCLASSSSPARPPSQTRATLAWHEAHPKYVTQLYEGGVPAFVVYVSLTHIPLRKAENHGFSCKTVLRRLASENRLTGTANDGRGSDST
jgi:hypothetical protein